MISMVPASMVSRRLMVRHRVDLPEPEAPMTATTSPLWMSRETSSSAVKSPKRLVMPLMRMRGAAGPVVSDPPTGSTPVSMGAVTLTSFSGRC